MLRSQVNKMRDHITSDVLGIWHHRQDALVKSCSDEKVTLFVPLMTSHC